MSRRILLGALGLLVAACAAPAPAPSSQTEAQPTLVVSPVSWHTGKHASRSHHRRPPRKAASPVSGATHKAQKPKVVPHHHVTVHHVSVGSLAGYRRLGWQLAQAHGLSAGQFSCVDAIFTRESHWNPLARNSATGTMGIPQRANAPAGWTDPTAQILWGLRYMDSRYGSPCSAWGFWRGHGWY